MGCSVVAVDVERADATCVGAAGNSGIGRTYASAPRGTGRGTTYITIGLVRGVRHRVYADATSEPMI